MSKLKQPVISLGASGSIADALTFQRAHRTDFVRKKPIPAQPRTLAQMYQRWDYQDYVAWWNTLTNAEKMVWRSAAVRYHMTGFAYYMKDRLTDLPDLLGRWRLDYLPEQPGHDSSKYQTHGAVIGATPVKGAINGALYFTLNDFVRIAAPQLNITSGDFSIIALINIDNLTGWNELFCRGLADVEGYRFLITSAGSIRLYTYQLAAAQVTYTSDGAIVVGSFYTVGFSRSGASVKIFKNGVDTEATAANHIDPASSARNAYIGIYEGESLNPFSGIIDNVVTFNRTLSASDHKRHSERRYPLP